MDNVPAVLEQESLMNFEINKSTTFIALLFYLKVCLENHGKCVTTFDAYFVISVTFVTIGFLWILLVRKLLTKLQNVPKNEWLVYNIKKNNHTSTTNGSLLEESI
jgi:hypothetical protein